MASDQVLFWIFGTIAVIGSLLVVLQSNPIYSVLSIILAFFGLAGLYVVLDAPFVAVIQIIIYAGAIMVLFLFVIMLLNVPREDAAEWDRAHPLHRPAPMRIGAGLAVLFAAQLGWAISRLPPSGGIAEETAGISSVRDLGRVLFTDYTLAFEVTSILIIVAMIGAVILARKHGE